MCWVNTAISAALCFSEGYVLVTGVFMQGWEVSGCVGVGAWCKGTEWGGAGQVKGRLAESGSILTS